MGQMYCEAHSRAIIKRELDPTNVAATLAALQAGGTFSHCTRTAWMGFVMPKIMGL